MLFAPKPRQLGARRSRRSQAATTSPAAANTRVLVSGRPPAHGVAHVDQLIGDDAGGGAPLGASFDFQTVIRDPRDVDVVHLISPDAVIGGPRTAAAERLRRATAFAVHVQRRRIALVQTLVGQGVRSPAEQVLDRVTTAFIARDGHQSTPDASRTRVIPHSHLRDRFLGYPRARAIAGRAVMVAPATLDAAYEAPVKVFAAADIPGSSLRIVGRAPAPLAASFARSAGRSGERVVIRDESLSDAERVAEITASEFVVIAAPETLESHATLLLAVSLGRPVLVEETPATAALAAEIGAEWVRTHPGRLTIARLEDAVASLNGAIPTHDPRLDDRAPNVVASMYRDLYRDAVNSVIR